MEDMNPPNFESTLGWSKSGALSGTPPKWRKGLSFSIFLLKPPGKGVPSKKAMPMCKTALLEVTCFALAKWTCGQVGSCLDVGDSMRHLDNHPSSPTYLIDVLGDARRQNCSNVAEGCGVEVTIWKDPHLFANATVRLEHS